MNSGNAPFMVGLVDTRPCRRRNIRALLGATAVAALAGFSPAMAQDNTAQAAQDSNAAADKDVIIVTAQRREEALEDVPMTISVVSGASLGAAGLTSLRDLSNVTTGFSLGQGGGFPQPAIRGVTTIINGTFENNVAIYIDGYYQIAPQSISIDLPNIDNVQILKGPQGTLYGRNATGGAILLQTISPTDTWRGKVEATYANYDDKRLGGYFAGPLSDSVGLSVSAYTRRADGYTKKVSRTVPGETDGNVPLKQDMVRTKLKVQLSSNLETTLAYNFTHVFDGRGYVYSPIENTSPLLLRPGGNTRPTKLGQTAFDFPNWNEAYQHEFTVTTRLHTGIGTLSSYSGYSLFKVETLLDFDGSYIQTGWNSTKSSQNTYQESLDFAIDAIKSVDLIVGGMYLHDFQETDPNGLSTTWGQTPSDPTVQPPFSNLFVVQARYFGIRKAAWAGYADATWHATSRLSLNVGGRYSTEKQQSAVQWFNGTGAVTLPYSAVRAKFSQFTPRASIRYELAPQTNIYASYSKGFRSGAFPTNPPSTNIASWVPAKQETVDAFEAGFKTASRGLRFDVAGFYYDYRNLQVSVTQTFGNPPTPLVFLTNAPKSKIYGIEGSFEYEPFENFKVQGGALWLHARFGPGALIDGLGVDPSRVGINSNPNPLKTYLNITQRQDLSGAQLSRAPNFSANLGADYLIPQGDGGIRFVANVKYTDSYIPTNPSLYGSLVAPEFQHESRYRQGKYALLNASVTWTHPSGRYYARLFGANLTDKRYRLNYSGSGAYGSYAPMAEPRTYGVTLGYTFGS